MASIVFDAPSASVLEFSYRVSSEYSPSGTNFYDGLSFYVDNQLIDQFQTNSDGTSPWIYFTIPIEVGQHSVQFIYSDGGGGGTDCSNTGCDDASFIDDFIVYSYVDSPSWF